MYSTIDDIKKLIPESTLVQLTDDERLGTVNQTRVDEAITAADTVINGYCGKKYSVPFAIAPDMVKALSVDIAIYNLYSRKVEEIPSTRETRYKNAISVLKGISDGTISIGIDPEPAATTQGAPETNKTESDRVFTRDKLKGF